MSLGENNKSRARMLIEILCFCYKVCQLNNDIGNLYFIYQKTDPNIVQIYLEYFIKL